MRDLILYSFTLTDYASSTNNASYCINFAITFAIIGFLTGFIISSICIDRDDFGFMWVLLLTFLTTIMGALVGMVLSVIWSLVITAIPIIVILYLFYRIKDITNWFKTKTKSKTKAKTNIANIINDLKAEEIAKQAYNSLKDDFPDIKYEDILENIRNK
jgi:uncharacterized protein YacL